MLRNHDVLNSSVENGDSSDHCNKISSGPSSSIEESIIALLEGYQSGDSVVQSENLHHLSILQHSSEALLLLLQYLTSCNGVVLASEHYFLNAAMLLKTLLRPWAIHSAKMKKFYEHFPPTSHTGDVDGCENTAEELSETVLSFLLYSTPSHPKGERVETNDSTFREAALRRTFTSGEVSSESYEEVTRLLSSVSAVQYAVESPLFLTIWERLWKAPMWVRCASAHAVLREVADILALLVWSMAHSPRRIRDAVEISLNNKGNAISEHSSDLWRQETKSRMVETEMRKRAINNSGDVAEEESNSYFHCAALLRRNLILLPLKLSSEGGESSSFQWYTQSILHMCFPLWLPTLYRCVEQMMHEHGSSRSPQLAKDDACTVSSSSCAFLLSSISSHEYSFLSFYFTVVHVLLEVCCWPVNDACTTLNGMDPERLDDSDADETVNDEERESEMERSREIKFSPPSFSLSAPLFLFPISAPPAEMSIKSQSISDPGNYVESKREWLLATLIGPLFNSFFHLTNKVVNLWDNDEEEEPIHVITEKLEAMSKWVRIFSQWSQCVNSVSKCIRFSHTDKNPAGQFNDEGEEPAVFILFFMHMKLLSNKLLPFVSNVVERGELLGFNNAFTHLFNCCLPTVYLESLQFLDLLCETHWSELMHLSHMTSVVGISSEDPSAFVVHKQLYCHCFSLCAKWGHLFLKRKEVASLGSSGAVEGLERTWLAGLTMISEIIRKADRNFYSNRDSPTNNIDHVSMQRSGSPVQSFGTANNSGCGRNESLHDVLFEKLTAVMRVVHNLIKLSSLQLMTPFEETKYLEEHMKLDSAFSDSAAVRKKFSVDSYMSDSTRSQRESYAYFLHSVAAYVLLFDPTSSTGLCGVKWLWQNVLLPCCSAVAEYTPTIMHYLQLPKETESCAVNLPWGWKAPEDSAITHARVFSAIEMVEASLFVFRATLDDDFSNLNLYLEDAEDQLISCRVLALWGKSIIPLLSAVSQILGNAVQHFVLRLNEQSAKNSRTNTVIFSPIYLFLRCQSLRLMTALLRIAFMNGLQRNISVFSQSQQSENVEISFMPNWRSIIIRVICGEEVNAVYRDDSNPSLDAERLVSVLHGFRLILETDSQLGMRMEALRSLQCILNHSIGVGGFNPSLCSDHNTEPSEEMGYWKETDSDDPSLENTFEESKGDFGGAQDVDDPTRVHILDHLLYTLLIELATSTLSRLGESSVFWPLRSELYTVITQVTCLWSSKRRTSKSVRFISAPQECKTSLPHSHSILGSLLLPLIRGLCMHSFVSQGVQQPHQSLYTIPSQFDHLHSSAVMKLSEAEVFMSCLCDLLELLSFPESDDTCWQPPLLGEIMNTFCYIRCIIRQLLMVWFFKGKRDVSIVLEEVSFSHPLWISIVDAWSIATNKLIFIEDLFLYSSSPTQNVGNAQQSDLVDLSGRIRWWLGDDSGSQEGSSTSDFSSGIQQISLDDPSSTEDGAETHIFTAHKDIIFQAGLPSLFFMMLIDCLQQQEKKGHPLSGVNDKNIIQPDNDNEEDNEVNTHVCGTGSHTLYLSEQETVATGTIALRRALYSALYDSLHLLTFTNAKTLEKLVRGVFDAAVHEIKLLITVEMYLLNDNGKCIVNEDDTAFDGDARVETDDSVPRQAVLSNASLCLSQVLHILIWKTANTIFPLPALGQENFQQTFEEPVPAVVLRSLYMDLLQFLDAQARSCGFGMSLYLNLINVSTSCAALLAMISLSSKSMPVSGDNDDFLLLVIPGTHVDTQGSLLHTLLCECVSHLRDYADYGVFSATSSREELDGLHEIFPLVLHLGCLLSCRVVHCQQMRMASQKGSTQARFCSQAALFSLFSDASFFVPLFSAVVRLVQTVVSERGRLLRQVWKPVAVSLLFSHDTETKKEEYEPSQETFCISSKLRSLLCSIVKE